MTPATKHKKKGKVQSITKAARPAPKDKAPAPAPVARGAGAPDLLRFSNSDFGNSQRLILMHGPDLLYSSPERTWLIWSGSRWLRDACGQIYKRAKSVASEFLQQANDALEKIVQRFIDAGGNPDAIA